jgi:hypothetical protein
MSSKVIVAADQQGNIIGISSNNPEQGYVRVEQIVRVISEQGWLKNSKRSALIKGKVEDLLACEFKVGQELPGKIIVKESLEAFNPVNPNRDLKLAGDTNVVCRYNDQPIYRQTFYTPNSKALDEFISHTNSDEIKDLQRVAKELLNMTNKTADLNN